jgi:tetratricopeptide (TPR) repeat protein
VTKVFVDKSFASVEVQLADGSKVELLFDPSAGIAVPEAGDEIYAETDCINVVTLCKPAVDLTKQELDRIEKEKHLGESDASKQVCEDALQYLRSSEPQPAVELLTEFLEDEPENSKTWYLLGKSHEELKESELAMEAYRNATRFDPCFHRAWNALGKIQYEMGFRDLAEKSFTQAVNAGTKYSYHIKDFTLEAYIRERIGFGFGRVLCVIPILGFFLTLYIMEPLVVMGLLHSQVQMDFAFALTGLLFVVVLYLVDIHTYRTDLVSMIVPWERDYSKRLSYYNLGIDPEEDKFGFA